MLFGGPGQLLTIRHDTTSREAFVPGVLLALARLDELPAGPHGRARRAARLRAFANGPAVATVEKDPTVVALEECSDEAGMAANGAQSPSVP